MTVLAITFTHMEDDGSILPGKYGMSGREVGLTDFAENVHAIVQTLSYSAGKNLKTVLKKSKNTASTKEIAFSPDKVQDDDITDTEREEIMRKTKKRIGGEHKKIRKLKDGVVKGEVFIGAKAADAVLKPLGFKMLEVSNTKQIKFVHSHDDGCVVRVDRQKDGKYFCKYNQEIVKGDSTGEYVIDAKFGGEDMTEMLNALLGLAKGQFVEKWDHGLQKSVGGRFYFLRKKSIKASSAKPKGKD